MKHKDSFFSILYLSVLLLIPALLTAQDPVSWLSDFTGDIAGSSSTFNYTFSTVDGNACKLKIEEKETDKKGKVTSTDWVFYLSDLDPSALTFKPSGKEIKVSLKIRNSQKFITESENGDFSGYTDEVPLTMSEVDKARAFIDAIKAHTGTCKQTDRAWNSPEEAFSWLIENVKSSDNSGTSYEQSFSKGSKPYMATLKTESTDSKGTKNTVTRIFDLSDLNPNGITLVVSGKSLKVEIPVRDKNYFITEKTGDDGISFARDMEIYADDIETARNTVNALNYLVTNTKAERPEWKGYSEALGFVKDNVGESSSSGKTYQQSLTFDASSSGAVSFSTTVTDSKGNSSQETSTLYLNDIQTPVSLNVSSRGAYLQIDTKNKNKYIKQTTDNNIEPWASSVKLYVDDIDMARNLEGALEFAIKNSSPGDPGLNSVASAITWLQKNVTGVTTDGETTNQALSVVPASENRIVLDIVTPGSNGATDVTEQYWIYPEDISTGDNAIKVSSKKLFVPLSTGKLSYVRYIKNSDLQNYTKSVDVLFDDVRMAAYFTQAIDVLVKNSKVESRLMKDNAAAFAFLTSHIKKIDEGQVYDQKIEKTEGSDCKLRYTLNSTDSKGATTEYAWEFVLSDIDPSASGITVSGKDVRVSLVTKNKQKLIKPYKNGEAQNFGYDTDIQANDILEAKKILAAFVTMANGCK